jgi:hypothetical protein
MHHKTKYEVKKWEGTREGLPPLLLGDPTEENTQTLSMVDPGKWDIYIGYVNDTPKGYFIITGPIVDPDALVCLNALHWLPFLPMIYNTGGPKLLNMMLYKIGEVCKENGWPAIMATNHSNYSDEAWTEKFTNIGRIKKVCSVFEFSEFPDS